MAERVEFELVAPEGLLLSGKVEMVVIPGTEGDFGVLPGHAPLISTIRPGIVEIYDGRLVSGRIFVAGGIAEVAPERCTVLAEEAMSAEDLNRGVIEADLLSVEANLPNLREQAARADGAERERLLGEISGLDRTQLVLHAKVDALTLVSRHENLTERL